MQQFFESGLPKRITVRRAVRRSSDVGDHPGVEAGAEVCARRLDRVDTHAENVAEDSALDTGHVRSLLSGLRIRPAHILWGG